MVVSWAANGQQCVSYGTRVTLEGKLVEVNEAGYNQYLLLKLKHPICTLAKPEDEFSQGLQGISQMQVFVEDSASPLPTARLAGMRVRVEGAIVEGMTGYYRTGIGMHVEKLTPLDAAGERAIHKPEPPLKDVPAYDVTVRAGPRLKIEARTRGSAEVLKPGDRYLPHWMTGGEVVYLNCREGYALEVRGISPPDATWCDLQTLGCMVNAFARKTITLRLACVKK
jgi:hypothetical protein